MGNRITRGFSRLGTWAAGLIVIAGLTATGMAAFSNNFGTEAIVIGLASTVASALVVFVFFWGIGWVITGFAKD
jgi:hypothetical protein